jgi:hypothetical protein
MALKMAQGDDTLKRPQWHAQNAVCTSARQGQGDHCRQLAAFTHAGRTGV